MAGDPARTMALLWRTAAGGARGPKPGLDVDRIVAAAIGIADQEDLTAVSMRRVAERLGVGTMSLYTYVPGRDDLVALMLDATYGQIPRPAHTPGRWRDNLTRLARDNWDLCLAHPWMLDIPTGRPVLGPHEVAKYDYELGAVDGAGLTDVEMDSVLTLVLDHVRGAARAAVEKSRTAARTGMTDPEWWQAHAPLLAEHLDTDRFPLAVRVGSAAGAAHDAASDPEHAFEFGLARILDGIEVLVAGRSGSTGR